MISYKVCVRQLKGILLFLELARRGRVRARPFLAEGDVMSYKRSRSGELGTHADAILDERLCAVNHLHKARMKISILR